MIFSLLCFKHELPRNISFNFMMSIWHFRGSCYLSLGEIEDASKYFKKCLQSGSDICVDRKIIVEASEGLQKAQVNFSLLVKGCSNLCKFL